MAKNKKLNKAVRARMERTGETYSTARMHILASLDTATVAPRIGRATTSGASLEAARQQKPPLRLYRGMRQAYQPEKVHRWWTNFTDDPYLALCYARGRHGVLIVVDVPSAPDSLDVFPHHPRLIQEGERYRNDASRLLVTGPFDDWIVATIPAKQARAVVNQKGVRSKDDRYRSDVLRQAIDRWLGLGEDDRQERSLKDCSWVQAWW